MDDDDRARNGTRQSAWIFFGVQTEQEGRP